MPGNRGCSYGADGTAYLRRSRVRAEVLPAFHAGARARPDRAGIPGRSRYRSSASQKKEYSLRANVKRLTGPPHPDRDRQFQVINATREAFAAQGLPIISVDTKKKELIGNFANAGRCWRIDADEVNAHDFISDAICRAVPYGVYDLGRNAGFVGIGTSHDTPAFAVDVIVEWWQSVGRHAYPHADAILILADSGGSNGCRPRQFKQLLKEKLADQFGLRVTVCHYPSGASKETTSHAGQPAQPGTTTCAQLLHPTSKPNSPTAPKLS